jgi:phosphatidylinositol 4-kinase
MLDRSGHVIHIDFGFMLSNSPGGNWGWESAPFKLTAEYVAVMGGVSSDLFAYFRMLVTRGFLEARAHVDEFCALVAVHANTSRMPCFSGPAGIGAGAAVDAMRARFAMHLRSESEVEKFVDQLIDNSINNYRTRQYDRFQKIVSGIL